MLHWQRELIKKSVRNKRDIGDPKLSCVHVKDWLKQPIGEYRLYLSAYAKGVKDSGVAEVKDGPFVFSKGGGSGSDGGLPTPKPYMYVPGEPPPVEEDPDGEPPAEG